MFATLSVLRAGPKLMTLPYVVGIWIELLALAFTVVVVSFSVIEIVVFLDELLVISVGLSVPGMAVIGGPSFSLENVSLATRAPFR